MQETLNKMVASVRHGFIAPEEASRTIHGSAAMLGLQLAENIPETSLIVTGMRKMVTRKEMIEAFREFGEIEDAAVSPNARGFGKLAFFSILLNQSYSIPNILKNSRYYFFKTCLLLRFGSL